jgi:hypothetical protein
MLVSKRRFSVVRWLGLFGLGCGALLGFLLVPATTAGASAPTPSFHLVAPTASSSLAGSFYGTSCTGPSFCVAVGLGGPTGSSTLAEVWNGSTWAVVPTPNTGANFNGLEGVSCVSSSFCLAVGASQSGPNASTTLVERWNGSTWTIVPSAPPTTSADFLTSVSCTATSFCMAAGYGNNATTYVPLAETWNGSAMTNAPPAHLPGGIGSFFYSVDCVSPTWCIAGGAGYTGTSMTDQSFAELWNGTAWSIQSTPDPSPSDYTYIESLQCLGTQWCVAVGQSQLSGTYQTFTLWWNGSTWTMGSSPTFSGGSELFGVSCNSTTSCVAVGDVGTATNTLILEWNGTVWTQVASPAIPASGSSQYLSVSCVVSTYCAAVGSVGSDVLIAAAPTFSGYWEVASDGGLFSFGGAGFYGSMGGQSLNQPVVGMAPTNDRLGYFEVASDGGLFAFGDAKFQGSMGGKPLNKPVVGMAMDPATGGYWEVASDGGLFAFNAPFFGSMGGQPLNSPVVGIAVTPDGQGYFEVAADGGLFAFGDAVFQGSMGGKPLNKPVVGMSVNPATGGYWEVASDGGLFSFNTPFAGSMGGQPLNQPMVGMAVNPASGGYWEVASDGGLFSFNAPFAGSMGGQHLNKPIVGMAQ